MVVRRNRSHSCTLRLVAAGAVALLTVAACTEESDGPLRTRGVVTLEQSGACGEAFFWAASRSGDVAVTVQVDVRKRATNAATTVGFSVPDDQVAVEVLRGNALHRNFCTDLPFSEPESRAPARRGKGALTLAAPADGEGVDPPAGSAIGGPGCGVKGTLALTELVADDGTRIEVPTVRATTIGCYAG